MRSSSLNRATEPETISVPGDALEYEAIDHAKANAAFAALLTGDLGFRGGKLLDLGTGPGDIPVAVCRLTEGAKVTAVEMSEPMTKLAAEKIARAGFAGRIALLRADAKDTKLPGNSFDFVVCNNLVHHIAEPELLFREIARLCRPGAGLLLKDLRRPDTLDELNAQAAHCAASTPRQRELLRSSLHAALRVEEIEIYAREAGLADFTLAAAGPRHWELRRRQA